MSNDNIVRDKQIFSMENTFFGFNTSIPFEYNESGGQLAEPSEEEYDALNDETFGSATNGDWEAAHENMVRLTDHVGSPKSSPSKSNIISTKQVVKLIDSDLDLNLSEMKLDDVEMDFDDVESFDESSGIRLDPSVWASAPCSSSLVFDSRATYFQGAGTLNQSHQLIQYQQALPNSTHGTYNITSNPNFCTLEDIEKNLIIEQTIRKQLAPPPTYSQEHQKNIAQYNCPLKQVLKTNSVHTSQQQQISPHQQNLQKQTQFSQFKGVGCSNSRGQPIKTGGSIVNNSLQHPMGLPALLQHQTNNHFSQNPIINQHGLSVNVQQMSQRAMPSSHLPIALNNFAMHPNFNAIRTVAAATGVHQAALLQPQQSSRINPHHSSPAMLLNGQQPNTMYNMFNMRLMQEIQQNHPLLQNTARQLLSSQQVVGMHISQRLGQHHQRTNNNAGNKSNNSLEGRSNGNLPNTNFDEYANLMSTRDKHWLIGIQLSQLNTDTPYIDDFYYTVHRERTSAKNCSQRHSQAHKDNQLNHPLTQPKGHAQLILVQLGSKNGHRNGQFYERQNSENNMLTGNNIASVGNNDNKIPYVFTPLKFENSLGKLQYGSVNAPRKIIDAEIMGKDTVSSFNSNDTHFGTPKSNTVLAPATSMISDNASTQGKSRHILLLIETLYRIVLKLEDLSNPIAISTIILKKKKENERIVALEQIENVNNPKEEHLTDSASEYRMNVTLKNKFTYEIEKKEILMAKLMANLSNEEVPAIMSVRKGKTLMRRLMPYIEDHEVRWSIWIGIFASLQNVLKRDKDDADGVLYALYPEFKKQIHKADFETILRVSTAMNLKEKKCNGIFCSKFGISSLVFLMLRAEHIYSSCTDITYTESNKDNWRNFLNKVSTSLNTTIQNQTICAEIESDSIQPLLNHFGRFQDLKLDSLLEYGSKA
ncbi:protein PAT1 homolog 1 isoform X2 [Eurosta solidaginis]|uniref:protein PAT1 homolog 1 isoform X2 n=1 Tax=Eurosta solidaginis TaxID=178769 RepID=UPI0035306424